MASEAPRARSTTPQFETASTSRPTSLEVLKRYKDFRLIWAGNFVAQLAQWIQMLTIGWLVLHLTGGNAILTGMVVGIRTLPVLIIGPWAGVLADRMDRRKLVMVTQSCMARPWYWRQTWIPTLSPAHCVGGIPLSTW